MEDQEIRIHSSYCDHYHASTAIQHALANSPSPPPSVTTTTTTTPSLLSQMTSPTMTPINHLLQLFPPGTPVPVPAQGESVMPITIQSLRLTLYAFVYHKRTWKRRLLLLTDRMLLVIKRPDDHYLKNALIWEENMKAVAVVSKKKKVGSFILLFYHFIILSFYHR